MLRARSLAWHLATLCFALAVPILTLAAALAWSYAQAERGRIEQDALKTAQSKPTVSLIQDRFNRLMGYGKFKEVALQ